MTRKGWIERKTNLDVLSQCGEEAAERNGNEKNSIIWTHRQT